MKYYVFTYDMYVTFPKSCPSQFFLLDAFNFTVSVVDIDWCSAIFLIPYVFSSGLSSIVTHGLK